MKIRTTRPPRPASKLEVKKSYLPNGTSKQVDQVLQGNTRPTSNNVIKEIKLQLVQKGLTSEYILDKYKSILETPGVKYRGSDVVNVLERLEKLNDLEEKEEAITASFTLSLKGKTLTEIKEVLDNLASKQQEYINKLDNQEVIEGETIK